MSITDIYTLQLDFEIVEMGTTYIIQLEGITIATISHGDHWRQTDGEPLPAHLFSLLVSKIIRLSSNSHNPSNKQVKYDGYDKTKP